MIPQKVNAKPPTSWLTDIRETAFLACVASVIGLVIPMWNMSQQLSSLESRNPGSRWWMIPVSLLTFLFTATLPAFYFALFRNEGTLRFPKRLRLLALAGAVTSGVIVVAGFPDWIRSLSGYLAAPKFDWSVGASNILTFARDPRTIAQLSTLLGKLSNIAYILMLIAIFCRQSDRSETDAPISSLLRRVTKVTVIAWGLVVSAVLLGLLLTPYTFYTLRNYAAQVGRTPPAFGDLFVRQLRTLLQQSCLFVAPYIVYRSQRGRIESPVDAQSGPEPLESGA